VRFPDGGSVLTTGRDGGAPTGTVDGVEVAGHGSGAASARTPGTRPAPARTPGTPPTRTPRTPSTRTPGSDTEPAAPPAGDAPLRVLLVEDDDADAFLVAELLDEAGAGIHLSVATSLSQAQPRVAGVDCVLLDLGLPDAQGLDGLRRLLAVAHGAAVCVLTGRNDVQLGAAAVAEGAQDYLIKGQVDGVLLARAIRYAVERRRADENARRLAQVELLQRESARLERGLLPQPLLTSTAVRLHAFYQPGRHSAQLGGDFYDVVQTGPDRLALMVGDVCGHGVDEAALGVVLRAAWRALILARVDDDAVLPAVEQVLISERASDEIFVTLASVTVDLGAGEAAVRLAGHPPPLLLAGGRASVVAARPGPVLGILPPTTRPTTRVPLGADWGLLLYTDGLIDGHEGTGTGRLEVEGLRAMVSGAPARRVAQADLPAWLAAEAERVNGGPYTDDVAMLLLCATGQPR
jgi:serine phosphatase RsbU (regulator of sigma subunit)